MGESQLEASLAVRWARQVQLWLAVAVDGLSAWLQGAWQVSLAGRVAGRLWAYREAALPDSRLWQLGAKGIQLFLCPPGEAPGLETWLGLVLGAAALLPTPVALGMLLLLLPFWLRRWAALTGGTETKSGRAGATRILLPFTALMLVVAGSVPASVVPRHSLVEFAFWVAYGLVFLLAMDAAGRGRVERVLWPVLAGAALSGAVGIWQYLSGWQPPQSWVDPRFADEITRVVGTFTNPTFFAEMMGLAAPVSIALLLGQRSWRGRLILGAFALLQTGGMLLSFSRGGWLGFAVSLAVIAVLYDRRLLWVGLAVALLAPFVLPEVLVDRFLSSFTMDDTSNNYRIFIWRGAWALARAYLWTGTGLGTESFTYTYPEHMIIQTP
ncbi:MAG TPA: hypothetical protein GX513_14265, partial [Firmicutes bacterium]|nr:hypothetical protein [Bacillota bacterium]